MNEQDTNLPENNRPSATFNAFNLSGQILVSPSGKSYQVEKQMGEGLITVVYEAVQEDSQQAVAVKVLKPGSSEVSIKGFKREAEILQNLDSTGREYHPKLIEKPGKEEPYFLVMELIDGTKFKELEKLLLEGPLPEGEALDFASQALDMLDRLHTAELCGYAYTDMQLKNFYWNRADIKLKVLDWNTLSTQRGWITEEELKRFGVESFDGMVLRDLTRMATFIYRALTGKAADQAGETAYSLSRRAGDQWEKHLSLAVRELLLRALHPNPQLRFATAREFLDEVERIRGLWKKEIPIEELYAESQRSELADYQSVDFAKVVEDAREKVDIAIRQHQAVGRFNSQEYQEEAENILKRFKERVERGVALGISARWGEGKKYYDSTVAYGTAASIWEEEASSRGEARLWRWVLAARAAREMDEAYASVKADVEALVEALEPSRDPAAAEAIARRFLVWGGTLPKALAVLMGEAEQAEAVTRARRLAELPDTESCERAVTLLGQAADWLKGLDGLSDYRERITQERGWTDLAGEAQLLEQRLQDRKDASGLWELVSAGLERDFWEQGLPRLRLAFKADPGNHSLITRAVEYARQLAADQNDEQALQILKVCKEYSDVSGSGKNRLANVFESTNFAWLLQRMNNAMDEGQWHLLPVIAARIPQSGSVYEQVQNLQKSLQNKFTQEVTARNIWAAEKLDEALGILNTPREARAAQLKTAREGLVTDTRARQQRFIEAEKVLQTKELEVYRVLDQIEIHSWIKDQYQKINDVFDKTEWENLDQAIGDLILTAEAEGQEKWPGNAEIAKLLDSFRAARDGNRRMKAAREEQIGIEKEIRTDLAKARSQLIALRPADFTEAVALIAEVREKYAACVLETEGRQLVRAQLGDLGQIMEKVRANELVSKVEMLRQKVKELHGYMNLIGQFAQHYPQSDQLTDEQIENELAWLKPDLRRQIESVKADYKLTSGIARGIFREEPRFLSEINDVLGALEVARDPLSFSTIGSNRGLLKIWLEEEMPVEAPIPDVSPESSEPLASEETHLTGERADAPGEYLVTPNPVEPEAGKGPSAIGGKGGNDEKPEDHPTPPVEPKVKKPKRSWQKWAIGAAALVTLGVLTALFWKPVAGLFASNASRTPEATKALAVDPVATSTPGLVITTTPTLELALSITPTLENTPEPTFTSSPVPTTSNLLQPEISIAPDYSRVSIPANFDLPVLAFSKDQAGWTLEAKGKDATSGTMTGLSGKLGDKTYELRIYLDESDPKGSFTTDQDNNYYWWPDPEQPPLNDGTYTVTVRAIPDPAKTDYFIAWKFDIKVERPAEFVYKICEWKPKDQYYQQITKPQQSALPVQNPGDIFALYLIGAEQEKSYIRFWPADASGNPVSRQERWVYQLNSIKTCDGTPLEKKDLNLITVDR